LCIGGDIVNREHTKRRDTKKTTGIFRRSRRSREKGKQRRRRIGEEEEKDVNTKRQGITATTATKFTGSRLFEILKNVIIDRTYCYRFV